MSAATGPGRDAGWVRRLAYGPDRRPLEPHRPLPWVLRGLSWLTAAVGFASLGAVAPLIVVEATDGVVAAASSTGVAALGLAVVVRGCANLSRPTPLVLFVDEADHP